MRFGVDQTQNRLDTVLIQSEQYGSVVSQNDNLQKTEDVNLCDWSWTADFVVVLQETIDAFFFG